MTYLLAIVLGLAFGAGDQYLGSLISLGAWPSTVSGMSAPWVLLPLVLGISQVRRRRAALLGLLVTVAALIGYFTMTYSPVEIHPWSLSRFTSGVIAVTTSGYNPAYIAGGLITGPLFGLLGQRWRVRRWWVSGAVGAGVLCLEPPVHSFAGQLWPPAWVWWVEVCVGVAVAGAFAVLISRRAMQTIESRPP